MSLRIQIPPARLLAFLDRNRDACPLNAFAGIGHPILYVFYPNPEAREIKVFRKTRTAVDDPKRSPAFEHDSLSARLTVEPRKEQMLGIFARDVQLRRLPEDSQSLDRFAAYHIVFSTALSKSSLPNSLAKARTFDLESLVV